MLRAVLFDFDGLILDTETPEVEILRKVFAEHGQEFPDEYWIHAFGRGADQIYEKPIPLLQRLCGVPIDIDVIAKEQRRRTVELIEQQPIRPGVVSLLNEVREADLQTAIVSSSRHRWVEGHLDRLGLTTHFQHFVCSDDVPRAKPFPDLYLRALEVLGLSRDECFALEDSQNGIAAAKAADVKVIAVENPLSAMLDLSAADALIPSLEGVSLKELWFLVTGQREPTRQGHVERPS